MNLHERVAFLPDDKTPVFCTAEYSSLYVDFICVAQTLKRTKLKNYIFLGFFSKDVDGLSHDMESKNRLLWSLVEDGHALNIETRESHSSKGKVFDGQDDDIKKIHISIIKEVQLLDKPDVQSEGCPLKTFSWSSDLERLTINNNGWVAISELCMIRAISGCIDHSVFYDIRQMIIISNDGGDSVFCVLTFFLCRESGNKHWVYHYKNIKSESFDEEVEGMDGLTYNLLAVLGVHISQGIFEKKISGSLSFGKAI